MARQKARDKGKARAKKLTVKKQPIKDLEAPKGKGVRGGATGLTAPTATYYSERGLIPAVQRTKSIS